MNIFSNNKIKNYWYIDEKGVIALIAQCKEYFEEERVIAKHKTQDRKASFKLAVKALAAIFGSASADAGIEQNISRGEHHAFRFSQKTEQQLNELINHLIDSDQVCFFENIVAFLEIKKEKLPLFCIAELRFTLDDDYYLEKTDPYVLLSEKKHPTEYLVELIKKEKFVLFKAELPIEFSYGQTWERVVLGASLEKWPSVHIDDKGNADFGRISHLAILLRGSVESPVNLKFLGHVTKMGSSLYIKPYAIWDIG